MYTVNGCVLTATFEAHKYSHKPFVCPAADAVFESVAQVLLSRSRGLQSRFQQLLAKTDSQVTAVCGIAIHVSGGVAVLAGIAIRTCEWWSGCTSLGCLRSGRFRDLQEFLLLS